MKTVYTLTQYELKEAVADWLNARNCNLPDSGVEIFFRTTQSVIGSGLPKTEYLASATFEEDFS